MATTYKVLGQSAPVATTQTMLYTVPALTQAVCSTLSICNRGVSTTFRIAIQPAGAALSNEHYVVYDNYVEQYDTVLMTVGFALNTTDVVSVYAGSANLSFSLFGSELT